MTAARAAAEKRTEREQDEARRQQRQQELQQLLTAAGQAWPFYSYPYCLVAYEYVRNGERRAHEQLRFSVNAHAP